MFVCEILLLLKRSSGISELLTWSCYGNISEGSFISISAVHSEIFLAYLGRCSLCARLWRQSGQPARASLWMPCGLAQGLRAPQHSLPIRKPLNNAELTYQCIREGYTWNRRRPSYIVLNTFIFKYVPDNKIERTLRVIRGQDQSLSEVLPGPQRIAEISGRDSAGAASLGLLTWLPGAVLALGRICPQVLRWGLGSLRDASLELEVNLEEKKRTLGE